MRGLDFFDIVDELCDAIDTPKTSPLFLIDERPIIRPAIRGYHRLSPLILHKPTKNGKEITKKTNESDFSSTFDVSSFKPEEISVKLVDRDIVVEGKHEEREDEHGFVSRQFSRRITLPKDYDTETITTYLNKDGKMTIKALKPKPIEPKERIIPIKRVAEDNEEDKQKEEVEAKKMKNGTEEISN